MELKNLIDTHLDLPRLSKDLDELGHPARVWATRHWDRATQAKLYEAAKGFRPVSLDDYVPAGTAPLTEVITWGMNTLPAHNHFQKRFAKPADPEAKDRLVGFNFQGLSGLTGPGLLRRAPGVRRGRGRHRLHDGADREVPTLAADRAQLGQARVASSTTAWST